MHHQSETRHDAGGQDVLERGEHVRFAPAEFRCDGGERPGRQIEAALERGQERAFVVARGAARNRRRRTARAALAFGEDRKAEIDVKIAHHRQHENGEADARLDAGDRRIDSRRIGGGDDEPEIERMFALVGVIDAGFGDRRLGGGFEPIRRDRQRGERRGAGRVRPHHRADARQRAAFAQPPQPLDRFVFVDADRFPEHGEWPLDEREIPLPGIDQSTIGRVEQDRHDRNL